MNLNLQKAHNMLGKRPQEQEPIGYLDSLHMDNFSVRVEAQKWPHLQAVFRLLTGAAPVTAWAIVDGKVNGNGITGKVLELYWHVGKEAPAGVYPLPAPLDPDNAARLAWHWLEGLDDAAYGPQPDIDGSCSRGWIVDTTVNRPGWTSPYPICQIIPTWAIHHK